jgi:predicted metal-dependent HD superfamily phosphohydrolase
MNIFDSIAFEDRRLLEILYSQPHRKYHNLSHITHVLKYCRIVQDSYTVNVFDYYFYTLASAFHDAYYDIGSKDNEKRSADLWRRSVTAQSRKEFVEPVAEVIEASANHWNPANENLSEQAKVFLDADIYELASEWELFQHNTENVIAEFRSRFSETEILKGRIAWMDHLLSGGRIYWLARDRDTAARENLKRSRDILQSRLEV